MFSDSTEVGDGFKSLSIVFLFLFFCYKKFPNYNLYYYSRFDLCIERE